MKKIGKGTPILTGKREADEEQEFLKEGGPMINARSPMLFRSGPFNPPSSCTSSGSCFPV